jgi:parvulin-like peptidyl-prolyl isomerase
MNKLVAAAFLLWTASAVPAELLDGVMAVVNDKIITYSEVLDYVQPVVAQLRRNYRGEELKEKIRAAQLDALNSLIDRALILQEFKDKGYSFPETHVDEQLNQIIAEDFGGDRAAFIRTLQAQNMTVAQYRDQLRDRLIVMAMRSSKTQKEVVVSPHKIETYYNEHLDEFKVEDQIKLRMIFIKKSQPQPPPPAAATPPAASTNLTSETSTNHTSEASTNTAAPSAEAAAKTEPAASPAPPPPDPRRRLAEELLAKLDEGDSFESLAKVYSEGREAKDGGDWGWIGKDVLRKELGDVAFSLSAGQHSRVIETPEGYYILYVEAVRPAHVRPLSEVRDEIEKTLLQQQRQKMQEAWIKQLRAKAYIRMF